MVHDRVDSEFCVSDVGFGFLLAECGKVDDMRRLHPPVTRKRARAGPIGLFHLTQLLIK